MPKGHRNQAEKAPRPNLGQSRHPTDKVIHTQMPHIPHSSEPESALMNLTGHKQAAAEESAELGDNHTKYERGTVEQSTKHSRMLRLPVN